MNLSEILKEIALNSGYKVENPIFQELLLAAQFELKPEAETELKNFVKTVKENGGFSLEAAKNNPDLYKHFTSINLGSIDGILESHLKDNPEIFESIKSEKSTFEKLKIALGKLKESKGKSDDEPSKGLKAEIEKLNNDLKLKQEETARLIEQAKMEVKQPYVQKLQQFAVAKLFDNKPYIDGIDLDLQRQNHFKKISEFIESNKGSLKFDEEKMDFQVVSSENPQLELYINNQPIKVTDLVDKIAAESKLYKVSDPTPTPVRGTTQQPNPAYDSYKEAIKAELSKY